MSLAVNAEGVEACSPGSPRRGVTRGTESKTSSERRFVAGGGVRGLVSRSRRFPSPLNILRIWPRKSHNFALDSCRFYGMGLPMKRNSDHPGIPATWAAAPEDTGDCRFPSSPVALPPMRHGSRDCGTKPRPSPFASALSGLRSRLALSRCPHCAVDVSQSLGCHLVTLSPIPPLTAHPPFPFSIFHLPIVLTEYSE